MLKSSYIHPSPSAPVVVIFGGNPHKRHHVVTLIEALGAVTVYGTLSEEEGKNLLQFLPKVNYVLIGGRYSDEQRVRIRKFTAELWPEAYTSEPGIEYPYADEGILNDLIVKLKI